MVQYVVTFCVTWQFKGHEGYLHVVRSVTSSIKLTLHTRYFAIIHGHWRYTECSTKNITKHGVTKALENQQGYVCREGTIYIKSNILRLKTWDSEKK